MRSQFIIAMIALIMAPALRAGECVASPDDSLQWCLEVGADGQLRYTASRDGQIIVQPSALGLVFDRDPATPASASLQRVQRASVDETWEQPWGEQRLVRDHHRELRVTILPGPGREPFDIVARVFDDAFAFRFDYRYLDAQLDSRVVDESTEFRLSPELQAWWYPALGADRDEYLYTRAPLSAVTLAETPLTLERPGLFLSIHEAALVDFSSMNLQHTGQGVLKAALMPWSDGVLVRRSGPFTTPWRMVLVGRTAADLANSRTELNLNEPSRIADTSFIKPMKYVGIWWEMHLGKSTWGQGPTHGANNANVRRYIDFAAENGFGGVLVEGWNTGWDGDWIANGDQFSFTQSYPDFDLPALSAYARERGVQLIGHNETGGAVENYEAQLQAALALYAQHGVGTIKTGYVKPNGSITRTGEDGKPQQEWFAGQYMVRHHLKVVEAAATQRIAINTHEPVKDTGLRRTWPNWVSREGARGQEFNAWGRPTNPPEHLSILPFTRLLAGPMDFTPGIFDLTWGKEQLNERVQSTLAAQLALYVVIHSPVQMAADLPENYAAHPDAFQFIEDVPVDWETSRTLDGVIGDYVVTARQERNGEDWYLGAVTDENARSLEVKLDFLPAGQAYEAQVYRDGPGADYRSKPYAFASERAMVSADQALRLELAPGGGAAIRFRAVQP